MNLFWNMIKRESNFELLRIVLALVIILCHFTISYDGASVFELHNENILNVIFAYMFRQGGDSM